MSDLVIGTGSGRCGTQSLAALFRLNGLDCTHERHSDRLTYEGSDLADEIEGADVHLGWIWYAERLLNRGARIVCLKRDMEETTASWLRKLGDYDHVRKMGTPNRWDKCFPTYKAETKEAALNMYWSHYYDRAKWLERYDDFKVFDTECLNTAHGQREILSFVGIERQIVKPGLRLNAA